MTKLEFASCIAVLESGIDRTMPLAQAEVWYQLLDDLSVEQLQNAVVRTLREYKFSGFPPVGLLREFGGAGAVKAITDNDRAVLAWSRVIDAIHREGAYRSVDFDDRVIHAAVRDLGGWVALCDTPAHDLHAFVRPRFLEAYRVHRAVGLHAQEAAHLPGIIEGDQGRDGIEQPGRVPVSSIATGAAGDPARINGTVESERVGPQSELCSLLPRVLVNEIETSEFESTRPPHQPTPSAEAQRAALTAKFG